MTLYRPRGFLLTKNEAAFFRVLQSLVPDFYALSCKVRLADLITCDDTGWNQGLANRISQKHIDFVVSSTDSSRIVAAIELDDSSHDLPERRERDRFVNHLFRQTGLKLIRIPAQWHYDASAIAYQLTDAGLLSSPRRVGIQGGARRRWTRRNEKSRRWSFGVAQSPKAHPAGRKRL
jgi:hypothetical protein